jgi:hypothetical protein
MKIKITFIVLIFTAVVVGQNQNEGENSYFQNNNSLLQKQQEDIKLR